MITILGSWSESPPSCSPVGCPALEISSTHLRSPTTTAKCKLKLGFYSRLGTFVLHFRVLMLNNSYMGEVTFRLNQQLLKSSCSCLCNQHPLYRAHENNHCTNQPTGHFWLSFWIPAGGWCFYMVTFLLFQSFGFRDGGGQYKSKNLKGQLGPSVNHERFYQEKLRERAPFLTLNTLHLAFVYVLLTV